VLLLLAGEDGNELAVPARRLRGSDVAAVAGRLPGEPGAAPAPPGGGGPCRGQAAQPILEHGPGRWGAEGGEGGEHEDVPIPEHVAPVRPAGQAPGAHRSLARVGGRLQQVEHGEASRQLVTGRPVDADVGIGPPRRPRGTVLGQKAIEPHALQLVHGLQRARPGGSP
jgi:hypothetical protein